MRNVRTRTLAAVLAAGLFAAGPASALERGATADGWPFVSGGVGLDEREVLAQLRNDYSLRVATAARGSGAYLAAAQVTIRDAAGHRVLEERLAGPILLVDLPAGRYTVEANINGEIQRAMTAISASARREIYFYFDVAVEVLPKDEQPR